MTNRTGFTLLEMLVTVAIIGMAAALVTPLLSDDDRIRVIAASSVLSSDIELAQVMTIARPNDPVIVRFEPDAGKYWLAFQSDPETPITRVESREPYVVEFGHGRALSATGTQMQLSQVTDNTLSFNAQGGLVDFTITPAIELTCGSQTITLSIAPTTGSISESNEPIPD